MPHLVLAIFSAVCGENPEHIWSPGGQPLPCCERCTGLYAGAVIAMALHLWFRPAITQRCLQLHALCLLQLGLFVFPWLPQSAALRTISGTLFGFGVVAFLWTAISEWRPRLRTYLRSHFQRTLDRQHSGRSPRFSVSFRPDSLKAGLQRGLFNRALRVSRFGIGAYAIGLAGCLALIPGIAEWGGRIGGFVLVCLVVGGAVALGALAAANVVRCLLALRVWVETAGKTGELKTKKAEYGAEF